MNTRYKSNPKLIANLRMVDASGDGQHIGDKFTSIQVTQDMHREMGLVQIEVRDFKRDENLIIEIELPELIAALSLATLHAERNS